MHFFILILSIEHTRKKTSRLTSIFDLMFYFIRLTRILFVYLVMTTFFSSSDIEIRSFESKHRQSVINLLISSFFLEEPLNAVLKFDIPHEVLSWADHLVDQSLRDQCSFVAIDTMNKHDPIVGVTLNGISIRDRPEEDPPVESEKLKFIFGLIDKISSSVNLFDLYGIDRLFHFDIINVESSQRGQNLSGQLINASIEKAIRLGIQGASVICTSQFSRKAFERQGFHVINELFYSEYDRLNDMGSHDRCTLLAKRL